MNSKQGWAPVAQLSLINRLSNYDMIHVVAVMSRERCRAELLSSERGPVTKSVVSVNDYISGVSLAEVEAVKRRRFRVALSTFVSNESCPKHDPALAKLSCAGPAALPLS